MKESQARKSLLKYAHQMYSKGWVANHDGNLSARVHDDRFVISPTGMSKADIELDDLVTVDSEGRKIAGRRRPFSELNLHRLVYARRPSVGAVVHAHPPHSTAVGASADDLPHPFLPEAVVSLGALIPTVPLAMPGPDAAQMLEPFVTVCDGVLITGNGLLTWGPNLELAFLRAELIEHLCQIYLASLPLGGVQPLPSRMVDALVAKRKSAGLAAPDEGKMVTTSGRNAELADKAAGRVARGDGAWSDARIRELTKEIMSGMGLDS